MGGLSSADAHGPIAYLSQFYPHLTETFVYREVLGLRARGIEVVTCACWPPDRDALSAESLPLVDETTYVFPLRPVAFVAAHVGWFARRPLRYLGTLARVTLGSSDSLRNRGFALLHFAMAVQLASRLQRRGVRHVHAQFAINAATIALVLSRLLDVPFSFTAHNLLFTKRMVLEEKIRRARFIVAISEATRRHVLASAPPGVDASERVHVVHCGLPLAQFPARGSAPANEVLEVLFIAQLQERKGATVLVEACSLLASRGVQVHCTVVGGGPLQTALEAEVERLGVRQQVTLTGALPQEELPPLLARADVFTLPCVHAADGDVDGIPVALMEAMATGIPTVSTPVSGIPELIEDEVSGLLVAEGSAEALAAALERLAQDPELRARLGVAGREQIARHFDVETTTSQLAELFA